MKAILANPLTTISGIITLLGVLFNAWQTKTISWPDLQAALVGLGLVFAKDFNVSGVAK